MKQTVREYRIGMMALGVASLFAAAPAPGVEAHAGHGPAAAPAQAPLLPAAEVSATPAAGPDPHAGHEGHGAATVRDGQGGADHEGHGGHEDHSGHAGHASPGVPAPSGPGPALPVPTPDEVRAAFPDLGSHVHMKAPLYTLALVDRLESQDADAGHALVWDARLQVGNDFDRLVLATEGERLDGASEEARHEAYWRHAFSRWWESRLGLRHDAGEGPGRDWVGVGIEGLAPYFVELSVIAYAGEDGRSAFTLEAEYDMRITNRLILQPRLELNGYGKDDPQKGIASGVAGSEVGLRLRYEVRREFAPYLGVEWTRRLGETADLAAAAGERRAEARVVAGLRLWY